MFTKAQLIEWFSDRYSDVQVIEALRIMRDHGADVDPEGDEFSPDITEELEKVFELEFIINSFHSTTRSFSIEVADYFSKPSNHRTYTFRKI